MNHYNCSDIDQTTRAPQQTPILLVYWLWTICTFLWGQLTMVYT